VVLPNGVLASGSDDTTIKLWDVGLRALNLPEESAGAAALPVVKLGPVAAPPPPVKAIATSAEDIAQKEVSQNSSAEKIPMKSTVEDKRMEAERDRERVGKETAEKKAAEASALKQREEDERARVRIAQEKEAALAREKEQREAVAQKEREAAQAAKAKKLAEASALREQQEKERQEREAQAAFQAPIVREAFVTLQTESEAIGQRKLPGIDQLTDQLNILETRMTAIRSLSPAEQATLVQQLQKDEEIAQDLQERYTIEQEGDRKAYYYLIQTHISELMVASLGVGSGYIDVNKSQAGKAVGWVCDALSSAFPGVSTFTTIVNMGVSYLDTRYRGFLLDKIRIFGHTITESERLGESIARLLVRAHYYAGTSFSSNQADIDAKGLIKVIVKANPAFEKTPDLAVRLVKALFKRSPCLDPLPSIYVAPKKSPAPPPVSVSYTSQTSIITAAVVQPLPPPSSVMPEPDRMQEILKRLEESERARQALEEEQRKMKEEHDAEIQSMKSDLQKTAKQEDVQRLKSKVDKIAPKDKATDSGAGLTQITRAEEKTVEEVRMTQGRLEHRFAHMETHVNVVTDEVQMLRDRLAELERQQTAPSGLASQSGFYSGKKSVPQAGNAPKKSH